MRVNTTKARFIPITIEIENEKELQAFLDMVGETIYDKHMMSSREYFATLTTDLYQRLLKYDNSEEREI